MTTAPHTHIIVGIDPGTRCGYAVRWPSGRYESGVFDLRVKKGEGGGMRFVRFRRKLADLLDSLETNNMSHGQDNGTGQGQGHSQEDAPRAVAFEDVRRHLGTDAAHVYGGIVAHLTEYCERASIPYQSIPVGTIKRHATGKGNADKTQMIAAARAKWPDANIEDDNEADARWIVETAIAEGMI